MAQKTKKVRWHFANVLDPGIYARRLWQFSGRDKKFKVTRDNALSPADPLPEKTVAKSWGELWKSKFNIAWLPADKIFLRVLHLPAADRTEALSMVEFQLEKISPVPVAQIVWGLELLSKNEGDTLQTAIVTIVPRDTVEQFLGLLEGQKFLADRLELPLLDELIATPIQGDGVWVFPGTTVASPCLVAWWYGGLLQNITVFSPAPDSDLAAQLHQQISQIAWAGELEGWLTAPPAWHLVAAGEVATTWEPIVRQAADSDVQVIAPATKTELAAQSVRRAMTANGTANLLPNDYKVRYRQQYVDRLWMRSLGALVVLYLIGIAVYFAALQVVKFQLSRVHGEAAAISGSYTNALKMEARIRVLEDRKNLQYAALDCWKAVAENLPSEVTVDQMYFQRGKTFDIYGTVPQEQLESITDFNEAMRRVKYKDDLLFSEVETPRLDVRGNAVNWRFSCKIRSGDTSP